MQEYNFPRKYFNTAKHCASLQALRLTKLTSNLPKNFATQLPTNSYLCRLTKIILAGWIQKLNN